MHYIEFAFNHGEIFGRHYRHRGRGGRNDGSIRSGTDNLIKTSVTGSR